MYVRLIARASSSDEATNMLKVLEARGVVAGSGGGGEIVLTLTREGGCNPNTGRFHPANAGEIQAFARWALEAGVPLALGVHGAALAREARTPVELSREMVEDLARQYGPAFFPVCHTIHLAAVRNGELAALRERIAGVLMAVGGRGPEYAGQTADHMLDTILRMVEGNRQVQQELGARDRRIAELEARLAAATERAASVAHQRNQAIRRLRRIHEAVRA